MEQTTTEDNHSLEEYGIKVTLPRMPIQSTSSNRIYMVCIVPGYEDCDPNKPCEHWKYRETKNFKYCTHILQGINKEFEKRLQYYENRRPFNSKAFFTSFGMVMARQNNGKLSEENRYIRSLILSLAYATGTVHSDDIYDAVGGEFMKSPSNIGTNFGNISKLKLIKQIGWRKSHRSIRHGGDQRIWELTEKGLEMCREMG